MTRTMSPKKVKAILSESDGDSDAGASPSCSDSDSSSVSSRSSSPEVPETINNEALTTSVGGKKKTEGRKRSVVDVEGKVRRKKNTTSSKNFVKDIFTTPPKNVTVLSPCHPELKQPESVLTPPLSVPPAKTSPTPGSSSSSGRKRKVGNISQQRESDVGVRASPTSSPGAKKRKLLFNQRRRTKSERNTRAGKVSEGSIAVAEGVVLDAEIDKLLEAKAIKTNLTATNVKGIIRAVVTDTYVQRMVMSTMKRMRENGNGGDSSDDEPYFEPKLTRARTKQLYHENEKSAPSSIPMWPLPLTSPAKSKPATGSETHVLIHDDLPEDSSGDEYVPKEDEVEAHSDDESSVISHTSEAESPAVSTPGSSTRIRASNAMNNALSPTSESCFKTPAPVVKPKCARRIDNAIGQRTRSKLPLTDTPLEELEMRLIPPDITTDMYDWGVSDNEEYLGFLKEFLRPTEKAGEGGDDEEADPEYNVMEEEEEHDKEELRRDRAVKVTKKELNELFAELLDESYFTSGDELNENDFTSFCASQLSYINMPIAQNNAANAAITPQDPKNISNAVVLYRPNSNLVQPQDTQSCVVQVPNTSAIDGLTQPAMSENMLTGGENGMQLSILSGDVSLQVQADPSPCSSHPVDYDACFTESSLQILEYQISQHLQLLAQTYALHVLHEEPQVKSAAQTAKKLIIEIRNLKILNGEKSVIAAACNCEPAWQFVHSWPIRCCSRSPIKKKILVEQFMSENNQEWSDATIRKLGNHYFPRNVAKAIIQSDAFIFPDLLPTLYIQNVQSKTSFLSSEDDLLFIGLDQLNEHNLAWKDKASVVARYLLTGRSATAVYHRIRNLRKTTQETENYFSSGLLPPSAKVPTLWKAAEAVAPIRTAKHKLPDAWWTLVSLLMTQPKMDEQTGSRTTPKKKKPVSPKKSDQIDVDVITTTFPVGTSVVQQHLDEHPDLRAVSQMNEAGGPEIYFFVPNIASPGSAVGLNSIPTEEAGKTVFSTPQKFYHPLQQYSPNTSAPDNLSSSSVLGFTTVGLPYNVPGIEGEVLDISAIGTPIRKALEEALNATVPTSVVPAVVCTSNVHSQLSRPKIVIRLRSEHSARTFGEKQIFEKSEIARSNEGGESANEGRCAMIENNLKEHSQNITRHNQSEHVTAFVPNDATQNGIRQSQRRRRRRRRRKRSNTDNSSSSSSSSGTDDESENYHGNKLTSDKKDNDAIVTGPLREEMLKITLPDAATSAQNTDGDGDNGSSADGGESKTSPNAGNPSTSEPTTSVPSKSDEGATSSPSRSGSTSSGGGNDDDDDRNNSNKDRKPLPSSPLDIEVEREEDEAPGTDNQEASIAEPKRKSTSITKRRSRAVKRVPLSMSSPKKRANKGAPIEVLLEEDSQSDVDARDAVVEAYLSKVRNVTEARHPGTYNELIKLLWERESKETRCKSDAISKAKILLKDYPDLVQEFVAFEKASDSESEDNNSEDANFLDQEEMQAYLNFIRHLNKFTEKSPQLRQKILLKFKVLKEEPTLTERDVTDSLAPFFQSNQVMMNAFKALYPNVYLPGPISSNSDFEMIDMDDESAHEGSDVEFVMLPDEKTVPATTSCPCRCHAGMTHSYSSRLKHCEKCCLKFQNGKVLRNSGRIARPVSVGLTSPSLSIAATSKPLDGALLQDNPTVNDKTKAVPELNEGRPRISPKNSVEPQKSQEGFDPSVVLCANSKTDDKIEDPETTGQKDRPPDNSQQLSSSSPPKQCKENTTILTLKPWAYHEDKLLLSTCEAEEAIEDAFDKLESLLPQRDRTEIESRCVELISLLQQRNVKAGECSESPKTTNP